MAYFNGKKVFFSPRVVYVKGHGPLEPTEPTEPTCSVEEVDTLPAVGEVGKIYRLKDTGELYCYLTASQFSATDTVPTIASYSEADEIIGQLMGYDTCHILFTAKLEHSGEEFSCIVYTNSDYETYTGRISSMGGTGDYGYGYDHMWCSSGQLCDNDLYFSALVSNAGMSYVYDGDGGDVADTIIITSITPLGQRLFDFSAGGKVNITTGKVE